MQNIRKSEINDPPPGKNWDLDWKNENQEIRVLLVLGCVCVC